MNQESTHDSIDADEASARGAITPGAHDSRREVAASGAASMLCSSKAAGTMMT